MKWSEHGGASVNRAGGPNFKPGYETFNSEDNTIVLTAKQQHETNSSSTMPVVNKLHTEQGGDCGGMHTSSVQQDEQKSKRSTSLGTTSNKNQVGEIQDNSRTIERASACEKAKISTTSRGNSMKQTGVSNSTARLMENVNSKSAQNTIRNKDASHQNAVVNYETYMKGCGNFTAKT